MKKPWYFMPFIVVYKIVFFVLLLPFYIVKYIYLSLPAIGKFLYKYILIPFYILCRGWWRFLKVVFLNLAKGIGICAKGIGLGIAHLCKIIVKLGKYTLRGSYVSISFIVRYVLAFLKYMSKGFLVSLYLIIRYIVIFIKYTIKGVETVIYLLLSFFGFLFPKAAHFIKRWVYYIVKGIECIGYILYKGIYYFINGVYCILYLIYRTMTRMVRYIGVFFLVLFTLGGSFAHMIERKLDWAKFIRKRDAEYEKMQKLKEQRQREQKQKELLAFSKQKAVLDKARKNIEVAEKNKQEAAMQPEEVEPPKSFQEKVKSFFYNLNHFDEYFKNKKMKKAISRPALVIDFGGADAVKSDKKVLYEYVAKTPEGKVVKDYFDAFSKVEVHSYLMSEGYEVYSIKTSPWITFLHGQSSTNKAKIKTKDLIFFITQLSTYIKAGIPLAEALKILARQHKKASYKKIFNALVYDLTMGVPFSEALEKQGSVFPKLLINMVKTSEMTGELPEALDDMAAYYTEAEKTRKQMVTALMYPTMVLVFAVAVVTFILIWVIPQFVGIYQSMDASKIPAFTLFVLDISNFLQDYLIWLLLGTTIFVIVFIYLYKHVQGFRKRCQWLTMHLPVFGNVVIYNEVTMFTKTFSSLLKHNVFITDSMEILTKVTNNEIYKILIVDTINNIAHGDKISKSFENHWAFPIPAYEMLVTGEKTGQLPDMMAKVSTYYQEQHAQQVARIKTFIEPVLIIFLTVVVGMIILAIIIPMFGMYDMIE